MSRCDSLADVAGLTVGHWTDLEAATGCTVVVCDRPTMAAVDVGGGAPGTRETDVIGSGTLILGVDAVVLSGGSAFGLASATGVADFLEKQGRGHPTPGGVVPIVPAAILYDLGIGGAGRPDAASGYAACEAASLEVGQGTVGAGTGATVAKAGGVDHAWKGGIGSASRTLPTGETVAALVAVNAFGDIYDETDTPLARSRAGGGATAATEWMAAVTAPETGAFNTTIGVVATDARLDRGQAGRLARMAHDGIALAVRPCHTMLDGDVVFSLSTGDSSAQPVSPARLSALGTVAVEVVRRAIANAVRRATSLAGQPAVESR